MKRINYLIILTSFFICLNSCDKNDGDPVEYIDPVEQALSQLPGGLPEEKSIDINNDGQYDFKIVNDGLKTDNYPPSYITIFRQVVPLHENMLLHSNDTLADSLVYIPFRHLFLKAGDTIRMHDDSEVTWTEEGSNLMGITSTFGRSISEGVYEYNWGESWTIYSELSTDFILAFKLKKSDAEQIGWMLLDLNVENGEISVIDSFITEADELIIELSK